MYIRHENGKLSEFWTSYLDMVKILPRLLRTLREGKWGLHISALKNMIPWCFAYHNVLYKIFILLSFRNVSLEKSVNMFCSCARSCQLPRKMRTRRMRKINGHFKYH